MSLNETFVSGDSHVIEPPQLFEERVPAPLKERVPKAFYDDKREAWLFGCADMPPFAVGGLWAAGRKEDRGKLIKEGFKAAVRGGWDPVARLDDMALDGVSAEVLYPSLGLQLYTMVDLNLQEACFRAYNDWLIEYCQQAPNRLIGIAMISLFNVEHAVAELERCSRAGLRGSMIWLSPPEDMSFLSDRYEPFWAASQDLNMPANLHTLTGFGGTKERQQRVGVERYRDRQTADCEKALFDIIFSGALERYTGLKVVLVEGEIGWIPFFLQRLERSWERHHTDTVLPMSLHPSEYFDRQCFATFEDDEAGAHSLSWWGADQCLWSSDYPHFKSTWPHSQQAIADMLGKLPAERRSKIIRTNVERLYKFTAPEPLARTTAAV